MQESFWWWQRSDRYIISLFPHLLTPFSPFSPSLISLMVFVDVKHHVYLLTFTADVASHPVLYGLHVTRLAGLAERLDGRPLRRRGTPVRFSRFGFLPSSKSVASWHCLVVIWSLSFIINSFTAPACKIPGLKDARTHLSYTTSTFSAMRFNKNAFTCQCETLRRKKRLTGFGFCSFIGRFRWHPDSEGVNET